MPTPRHFCATCLTRSGGQLDEARETIRCQRLDLDFSGAKIRRLERELAEARRAQADLSAGGPHTPGGTL